MTHDDEIVLEEECRAISGGLHPSTRWRLERQGLFPKRFKIGNPNAVNGRVGWSRTELREWRAERMRARNTKNSAA